MERKPTLHIVGVDTCSPKAVSEEILNKCNAIVVSERLRRELGHLHSIFDTREIIPIAPLVEGFSRLEEALENEDAAILASGDPMFFGIGKRAVERFGEARVKVYPAVSSVQNLCAHFRINWDDATLLSLHGRPVENSLGLILSRPKVLLLTDGTNRPQIIAQLLCEFLGDKRCRNFTVYVGENIGMVDEKFTAATLEKAAETAFGPLSSMLLVRGQKEEQSGCSLGLTEQQIAHSRGLITKNEVRAAVLHALALEPNSVLWDVGSGSGSVSLEASRLHKDAIIYAVEKNIEQCQNIQDNINKYNVYNISAVEGEAPGCLAKLPQPDRVFIGGSGGNLEEIIKECSRKLETGGRIVVTAVLDKTRMEAPRLLCNEGLEVEASTIAVTRTFYPENRQQQFNPITVVTGRKTSG